MSRETDYTFCLSPKDGDGSGVARSLIQLVGVETIHTATRSRRAGDGNNEGEAEEEYFGTHLDAAAVPDLFVPRTVLGLIAGTCPLRGALNAAVKEAIPAAVRGEYFVNHLFIDVGEQAVRDTDARGRARRPRRCFAAVTIHGSGTPDDPAELFRRLEGLPLVADLAHRLGERFGRPAVAVSFSV